MMTFPQSIATVFRQYAEFAGRATRAEFWWWVLFTTLVSAGLNALNITVYRAAAPAAQMVFGGWDATTYGLGSGLAGLWGVAVLVPSLAVAVRRLRDAGRRWPELFWLLLPIAGPIVLIVHLADPSVPVAAPAVETAGAAPGSA
ncbi:MAG: DUF805 domain-containing protein [Actinomycetales bacterium]|nr:DUF805 domain-containing protein [Actinomycetales bacterium]